MAAAEGVMAMSSTASPVNAAGTRPKGSDLIFDRPAGYLFLTAERHE
jgi:hypothetical protein